MFTTEVCNCSCRCQWSLNSLVWSGGERDSATGGSFGGSSMEYRIRLTRCS